MGAGGGAGESVALGNLAGVGRGRGDNNTEGGVGASGGRPPRSSRGGGGARAEGLGKGGQESPTPTSGG